MIPDPDPFTGYLPAGLHLGRWGEVQQCFARNVHRSRLLGGLLAAVTNLVRAGCREVLLDGSFVTQKELPSDYDAAWNTVGVDPYLLDPVLLDFTRSRAAMKAKFFGELFPAQFEAAPGVTYRDFFQQDKSGTPKGIVKIDLGSLP